MMGPVETSCGCTRQGSLGSRWISSSRAAGPSLEVKVIMFKSHIRSHKIHSIFATVNVAMRGSPVLLRQFLSRRERLLALEPVPICASVGSKPPPRPALPALRLS